jgi:hypothetical protein
MALASHHLGAARRPIYYELAIALLIIWRCRPRPADRSGPPDGYSGVAAK